MAITLCGAHGTGKTTLAAQFAHEYSWLMIPSGVSGIFKELDLPFTGLSFEDRLRVQNLILERFEDSLIEANRNGSMWISDRSPIDMAAYMMAEWGQRCNEAQGELLMNYVDRCMRALNRHSAMVMIVPPGIPYIADPKRPAPNRAYQEVHHLLCSALVSAAGERPFSVQLRRVTTDLGARVQGLRHYWECNVKQNAIALENVVRH